MKRKQTFRMKKKREKHVCLVLLAYVAEEVRQVQER
jgi:hypothetical protein